MVKTDIARTITAIACTILMSATCLVAAIGPATQQAQVPVAASAHLVA